MSKTLSETLLKHYTDECDRLRAELVRLQGDIEELKEQLRCERAARGR